MLGVLLGEADRVGEEEGVELVLGVPLGAALLLGNVLGAALVLGEFDGTRLLLGALERHSDGYRHRRDDLSFTDRPANVNDKNNEHKRRDSCCCNKRTA